MVENEKDNYQEELLKDNNLKFTTSTSLNSQQINQNNQSTSKSSRLKESPLPSTPPTTLSTITTTISKRTTTTTTITTTTTKLTTTTTQKESFCNFNVNKTPLRNALIFNEICWMGTTQNSNAEWIEIKNISNQTLDISSWQIIDKDQKIKIVFPKNTKILPNGLILLERSSDESIPNVKADFIFTGVINNQNEGLRIFDNFCNLQDEVFANPNWPEGDNDTKRTMERRSDLGWQTSSEINGTPKRENSSGYLKTNFSFKTYSGTTTTSTTIPVTTTSTTVFNTTTTSSTRPPSYPKLLINEIKIAGKNINGEVIVKDEFIELHNPNDHPIDLTDWYIQKKTKNGTSYSSLVTKSVLAQKVIPSKGYFVIGNILSFASSTYDAVWEEKYTLAENNTIVLKNPSGEIVDKVGWGEVNDSENQPTINPEPQKSIQRKKINNEPVDSDNNFDDFELLNCPTPKEIEESCILGETTQKEDIDLLNPFIKNFSWRYFDETKSKVVIEFEVDNYPFILNTTSTTNHFFGLAFYLNQGVPVILDQLGEYNSVLGNRNSWEADLNFSTLVLKYPDCQGYELLKRNLVFTILDDFCHAPGMPWGIAYRLDSLPKNNHFIIEVVGKSFDTFNNNFSENDYITIGFYGSVYPSYLKLIYPDNHKYYFEPNKFYHFPERIENFTVSFSESKEINSTNNSSSTIYFIFNKGIDRDLNDELTYEVHYAIKKENDSINNNDLTRNPTNYWLYLPLSSSDWYYNENENKIYASANLSNFNGLIFPIEEPISVYLAIRARDKMGLLSPLSEIKEITIFPPHLRQLQ